jgi:tRNA nucleotidyltransferase (CCA-adding enzyme)
MTPERPAAASPGAGTEPARFELWPHDADVGVRGFGPTKAQAFAQAALAITALVTDPARVAARVPVEFCCSAPDDELLLARWLNEVIYAMATRNLLFARFEVSLQGDSLQATGHGEAVDRQRHEPAVEPKGATLTGLRVAATAAGWLAQCVVDV